MELVRLVFRIEWGVAAYKHCADLNAPHPQLISQPVFHTHTHSIAELKSQGIRGEDAAAQAADREEHQQPPGAVPSSGSDRKFRAGVKVKNNKYLEMGGVYKCQY
jgi:hypothetical protein